MYIYIYIHVFLHLAAVASGLTGVGVSPCRLAVGLPTDILDFRGFDSSTILILRGEISWPIGNLPEVLSLRRACCVRSAFNSSCFKFYSRPWGFEFLHAYAS